MLKAVRYKVKVFKSVLDWSHGMGHVIEEVFIPERCIIFNLADGESYMCLRVRENVQVWVGRK